MCDMYYKKIKGTCFTLKKIILGFSNPLPLIYYSPHPPPPLSRIIITSNNFQPRPSALIIPPTFGTPEYSAQTKLMKLRRHAFQTTHHHQKFEK